MSTTIVSSVHIREFDKMVRDTLERHHVSPVTGFLAEKPLRQLPTDVGSWERCEFFAVINYLLQTLPAAIRDGRVREQVREISPKCPSLEGLSWEDANLLHFCLSMLAHASLREAYPYLTVDELHKDDSIKVLTKEIAVPLGEVSKITGALPTMAYGFYSLFNGVRVNPEMPFALYNFRLIYSFTGGESELWFVGIHQVGEALFAPAIPAYLRAYHIAKMKPSHITEETMHAALIESALPSERWVDVIRAMRAHLNPKEYFQSVRLFYMFPRNIVYEGVEELRGEPQNYFGETGGQSPFRHFQEAALGIYPHEDKYFPTMRLHMQGPFRELIESLFDSRVREFTLSALKGGTVTVARAYNRNIQAILDWRLEHRSLVATSIEDFGDKHGTGKSPLTFLDDQIERTRRMLIPIPE